MFPEIASHGIAVSQMVHQSLPHVYFHGKYLELYYNHLFAGLPPPGRHFGVFFVLSLEPSMFSISQTLYVYLLNESINFFFSKIHFLGVGGGVG